MDGQKEYKFYYFTLHGRGDPARALLNHAKIPFENIEFGFDKWPEHKPNMPNQQVPCLELKDGTKMGQPMEQLLEQLTEQFVGQWWNNDGRMVAK